MPNQPCFLFTINNFLNLPENKFFDYFNHCTNVPVLPSHWQKGSTWISRSPILFPGSYPAYFKNIFFYRKSSSFECMKRKMMLKPGSEISKVFEVSCRDWGCIFPTVLGVLFKIVGIPRVTDLGNDGGLQKKWICFKHLQDQNYCQFYILIRIKIHVKLWYKP